MVSEILLKNCQSFENVSYPLAQDKVNVIVAENDTGKSILFKMLKLVGCPNYYDKKSRKDLIRYGCDVAEVIFKFTDDSVGYMQVREKSVVYGYRPQPGAELEVQYEPIPEMVDKVGLLVSDTEPFVANIVDMDQGLLLVNNRLKSNWELIKMIATSEKLDTLEAKLEEELSSFRRKRLRANDHLRFVQNELNHTSYTDIEKLEADIKVSKAISKSLSRLGQIARNLQRVECKEYKNYDFLLGLVNLEDAAGSIKFEGKMVPEEYLNALEKLEQVATKDFNPVKKEKKLDFEYNALVKLLRMREKLNFKEATFDEKLEPMTEGVGRLETLTQVINRDWEKPEKLKAKVEELESMFASSGEKVQCPIYGEVIWDGKNCVADN